MTRRIVIVGGGTGGTLAANRLRHLIPDFDTEIVVVDGNDRHLYQPGLLHVPFGLAQPAAIVRSRQRQLRPGIVFIRSEVERVDLESDRVILADGSPLGYDVLVVASGAALRPEETEGLTGPGWRDNVLTFYDLEGAAALAGVLATMDSGRLVVNVVDLPIKCPVAPLEFCFLADWFLRRRGVRQRVELTYVTPLDGVFTRPVANRELSGLLDSKGIEVVTEFNTGEADGAGGRLVSYDGREIAFDLAVVVPLHGGAPYVERSEGLGDELGFVPTDPSTLQSKVRPNVFVLGDATDLPSSKAGSVTHFQGHALTRNVACYLKGEPITSSFDGHANCFVETGFGKALLIDFNYEYEPLPGHYPGPIGLPLLKESRLNHLAKMEFESFYWHVLLQGRHVPGIHPEMPRSGKVLQAVAAGRG
ncbi:MAG TPA: FAD/NAD(P)-binding oxidoreductase [Acidimicrobiales bacterium]|nr:FAD/NAD(P)-binding oxidoreductase [Acidimicrobiales bacterium]